MADFLPSTSYIKMMDIWMLSSLSFTFLEVILFVLVELVKKRTEKLNESIVNIAYSFKISQLLAEFPPASENKCSLIKFISFIC